MHKLIRLRRQTQKNDGTAYKTGKGVPFTMLYVKVEGKEKDISFFEYADSPSKEWTEGQEVAFEIEQNGEYLNGKFPKKDGNNGLNNDKLENIDSRTFKMSMEVLTIKKLVEEIAVKVGVRAEYLEGESEIAF